MTGLFLTFFLQAHLICLPSERPLSSHLIEEALDYADLDGLIIAPSILEDLSQSSTAVEKLSRMKSVVYGGGTFLYISESYYCVS